MPLYDFLCEECKTTFEELLKTSLDVSQVRCSKCGSARVARQLGVFATSSGREGSSSSRVAPAMPARPAGGGCGSGCGCHS